MQRLVGEASWLKRRFLRKKLGKLKPNIEEAVARECPDVAKCSPEALTKAVSTAIEKTLSKGTGVGRKVGVYSAFVGAIAVNAVLSALVQTYFQPATATLISSCLTVVSATFLTSIGAPVVEPIAAWIRRWAWGTSASAVGHSPLQKNYEKVYTRSQEALNSLGSLGRGIQRNAVQTAVMNLVSTMMVSAVDRAEAFRNAPAIFALVITDLKKAYHEVDLTEPEYVNYAQLYFSVPYLDEKNYTEFSSRVLLIVTHLDESVARDPRQLDNYRRIIKAWFEPREDLRRLFGRMPSEEKPSL